MFEKKNRQTKYLQVMGAWSTLGANTSHLGVVHSGGTPLQEYRTPDKEINRLWLEDKGNEWNDKKKLYRRV